MPTRYIFYDEYGNKLGEHVEPTDAEKAIGTIIFFGLMFSLLKSLLELTALFIQYCIEHPRFAALFFGILVPVSLYITRKYPGAILFVYPFWVILIVGAVTCLIGTLGHRFLFPILATMTMASTILNFYYWFGHFQWPVSDGIFSTPFFVFAVAGVVSGVLAWFVPRLFAFFLGGLSSAYFAVVFVLGGQGDLSNLFSNPYIFLYPIFILAFLVGAVKLSKTATAEPARDLHLHPFRQHSEHSVRRPMYPDLPAGWVGLWPWRHNRQVETTRRYAMSTRSGLLTFMCLLLLTACTPQDEAELRAAAEQARQTAVALGKEYLATEAPKAKETALAEGKKAVETTIPQIKGTAAAAVETQTARVRNTLRKVVLDPGHGWLGESGASYFDLKEKDVNLNIALLTQQILERDGFRVAMTRTADDPDHDLTYAAQFANAQKPDIVVSIHANAAGESASGTEACYTVGKRSDEQSKQLAKLLTTAIAERLGLQEIGIFPENSAGKCARTASTGWTQLYIHDMDAPTALIETAFLSNRSDAKLLTEQPGDFAQAIADAVERYFESPGK